MNPADLDRPARELADWPALSSEQRRLAEISMLHLRLKFPSEPRPPEIAALFGKLRQLLEAEERAAGRVPDPGGVERIDLECADTLSDFDAPAKRICSFFWSEKLGLRCASKRQIELLTDQGIAVPPLGELVFPYEPARFFAGLPFHYSGSYVCATLPRPATAEEVRRHARHLPRWLDRADIPRKPLWSE